MLRVLADARRPGLVPGSVHAALALAAGIIASRGVIFPEFEAMVTSPSNTLRIAPDVRLGKGVKLHGFVNLYGCEIGDETRIGCFVEIQKGVKIGARCKISSHTFICEGVTIEDGVFIGHGVMFGNDRRPRAVGNDGEILGEGNWECLPTLVREGASIGSGSVILGGLVIGEKAMIGAGSVVTKDVPPEATVAGNPACRIDQPKRTDQE